MPTSPLTAVRWVLAVSLLTVSVALSGCSQVSAVVERILPERSGVHTLVVGECFNDAVTLPTAQDAVVDLPRENCTLKHDNEVIASIQLEGEKFPGDDAVVMQGFETCLPEFEAFIGAPFEQAGTLEYDFFVPSPSSWLLGDRELLCFVYDSAGQTAYTLEGARSDSVATPEPAEGES
jgi:hypothetical protein